MKKNRITALMSALLLVTALGCSKKQPTTPETETLAPTTTEVTTEAVPQTLNPFTGAAGYDERYLKERAVGIVVENSPAARPQWGMSTPDMVLEYEVEGGISRMLWIYANADEVPAAVGPVRSARHDIVELALGWDLIFIHCGGSPTALNMIRDYAGTLPEVEGLRYDDLCFYRDGSRDVSAEHTLVLQGEKLRYAFSALDIDTAVPRSYPLFFENSPHALPNGGSGVHIEYSGYYTYDFKYNVSTGKYDRSLNGNPVTDAEGIGCDYTNVLVLYVDTVDLGDSDGHIDLLLENGGSGLYFSGGRMETVHWEKNGETAPLRLLNAEDAPLALNPGNSYVGLVRSARAEKTVIAE